jgi:hypothetical protein
MQLPADMNKLSNPQIFFESNRDRCVIIDEVQRMPELFPVMRSLIDRYRVPGRFLILGSAGPELLNQSSESLAGRIAYTELTGLMISEVEKEGNILDLWINGGFPEPYLLQDPELRQEWYRSFMMTYIERDLPLLGLSANPMLLHRMLQMLANSQGSLLNLASFSRSLGISIPTVSRYLGFLQHGYIVRILQPWHSNVRKRLVKSPKTYIRDPGILHHLLGLGDLNALMGHPVLGGSWEGFVTEQIISHSSPTAGTYFYRTAEGAECDLVITRGLDIKACVEIKFSEAPAVTRGLTTAIRDLNCKRNFIIIPDCPQEYQLKDDIIVCSLPAFVVDHLPEI